jgi:hypothetical protein
MVGGRVVVVFLQEMRIDLNLVIERSDVKEEEWILKI